MREAHRRGLRVITELVINHTSDQHPWFQAARRAPPGSRKRDYYVWSDTTDKYAGTRIIFTRHRELQLGLGPGRQGRTTGTASSATSRTSTSTTRTCCARVLRVMGFWLDLGVDGFRLDAIPYLVRARGHEQREPARDARDHQAHPRAIIDEHYADRMLLAEANQWPEDVREYFGDGDECHMAYHFPLMPRMYMAIAQEDRHPIVEIMEQTPDIPR